jgi:hydrogenase nickel incorporation protein HypB
VGAKLRRIGSRSGKTAQALELLSVRELEVFRLIGKGDGTRRIAEELHLSVKTVESYQAHIKVKLMLQSSRELVQRAIEWRLAETTTRIMSSKQNDLVARGLRQRFRDAGVFVVGLVSSPGAGKTSLLEQTLSRLLPRFRVAALVGDLATENDAARLARSGAPVRQITTGTVCHLEAAMVETALDGWALEELDFLFIENVGNLVCPASYDLGENMRLVVLSVTEGEDTPLKYPIIFHTSDVALVSKIDLAEPVGFDWDAALASIQSVRPGMRTLRVSAKTGAGMSDYLALLESGLAAARGLAVAGGAAVTGGVS